MANHFFIYARKSTDSEERQVRSIEDQIAELKDFAARENIIIKEVFTEAMTAKAPGRPVFDQMISRIEKGEARGILAWHPDRLARNSVDGGRLIHLLDTGHLTSLKFCTFWFENTPQGKFMLQIAFGQSKYYIDNLSENVKRGLHQKFKRGDWPCKAPLGYLNDKSTRKVVLDPVKGPLTKKLFEVYATGKYTVEDLKKIAASWGLVSRSGTPLSKSKIFRTLTCPFYYGLMEYAGDILQGTHEPLVTKSLFDQVQQALTNRGKPHKYKKKHFPLLGLARCAACGGSITAELQKGHHYYRCTKKKGPCPERQYTREEILAAQINQALTQVSLPQEAYDFLLSEWAKDREVSNQPVALFKQKLAQEIPQIEAKLNRLLDAHLEGAITQTEYLAKKESLLNQKISLEQNLSKLEQGATGWFEPLREFLQAAHHAGKLASGENLEAQKEFLKKIGLNFCLGGRLLSFEFKNPWRLFLDFPSNSNHLGAAPAGSFFASPAAKAAGFFQNPDTVIRMSGRQDSNLRPPAPKAGAPPD